MVAAEIPTQVPELGLEDYTGYCEMENYDDYCMLDDNTDYCELVCRLLVLADLARATEARAGAGVLLPHSNPPRVINTYYCYYCYLV